MQVELHLKIVTEGEGHFLAVEAINHDAKATMLVAHARYYLVELENEFGQFARGERSSESELPKRSHYVTLEPKERVELLRFAIQKKSEELIIGDDHFVEPPPRARARVTYKAADRIMPNLPRDRQKSFFAGPADAVSEALVIERPRDQKSGG